MLFGLFSCCEYSKMEIKQVTDHTNEKVFVWGSKAIMAFFWFFLKHIFIKLFYTMMDRGPLTNVIISEQLKVPLIYSFRPSLLYTTIQLNYYNVKSVCHTWNDNCIGTEGVKFTLQLQPAWQLRQKSIINALKRGKIFSKQTWSFKDWHRADCLKWSFEAIILNWAFSFPNQRENSEHVHRDDGSRVQAEGSSGITTM